MIYFSVVAIGLGNFADVNLGKEWGSGDPHSLSVTPNVAVCGLFFAETTFTDKTSTTSKLSLSLSR